MFDGVDDDVEMDEGEWRPLEEELICAWCSRVVASSAMLQS